MRTVELGNEFYFFYLAAAAVYLFALVVSLRGKSRKTVRAVLWVILLANFSLHFLKQAFPPYCDHAQAIRRSTVENLCAVSTVFFPFIFLFKKQNILHDYMYFIGMCAGLGALFYPVEAIGMPPFAFDSIRFYACHINLMAVPLVAAVCGVYRPRPKSFWAIPLLFLVWETVICLNEFFLMGVGLVDGEFADLLNAGFRNSSFAFGVRPDFAWAAKVFDPLVPWFFRTDAFGLNGGMAFYFPVLWLVLPATVFLIPLYLLLCWGFYLFDGGCCRFLSVPPWQSLSLPSPWERRRGALLRPTDCAALGM